MAKVITFSKYFPSYHPKAGQKTFFAEQIHNSLYSHNSECFLDLHNALNHVIELDADFLGEKHHTIRKGNRFKVGDEFSPRVWAGKPYRSKQIIIAPNIVVAKVWEIEVLIRGDFKEFIIHPQTKQPLSVAEVAANDGLELNNFLAWFNKPFYGQIICWDNEIVY